MLLLVAALAVVALLLVWLSLSMAAAEAAVGRVTRASLNNLIFEVQTDTETSRFSRLKKIARIHTVQRLIADRFATSGSCAFFRIACNVLDGVLVSCIAALFGAALWEQLLIGLVFALIVAVISILVRPRSAGASKPVDILLGRARLVSFAVAVTPFAHIGGRQVSKRRARESELSDDEELEKIQLEQGRAAIDRLVESNDFDPEVSEMLRNVLTLSDTLTREIMVPRTDMICIEHDASLEDLLKLCTRSGFSRVPVIGEDVDDLVGIVYLKDAVRATAFNPAAGTRSVETICRQPMLVPESKPVDDLFHEMQRTRQHVAMVVDEYGGIAGLVTIEDTLEQIVGELEDEHDRTQHSEPERVGERTWRMPARTPIADLEEIFEVDIDEDDVDTVYGLLTKLLGRVPIVGNSAVTRGLKLTAVDSAGRRKKVSTVLVEPAGESNGAPADLRTQEESKVSSSSESSDASRHENQDNDDSRSDGSRSSDKRNTSKHDKYSIDRHSVDKHGIDKHSDDAAQ
jgi:CBS domain containing-hemolysin-like protein